MSDKLGKDSEHMLTSLDFSFQHQQQQQLYFQQQQQFNQLHSHMSHQHHQHQIIHQPINANNYMLNAKNGEDLNGISNGVYLPQSSMKANASHAYPSPSPSPQSIDFSTKMIHAQKPLYENKFCTVEDMKQCVKNHRLKAIDFGRICQEAAKRNFARYQLILNKFIRENSNNIVDFDVTEECYEDGNQQLLSIAASIMNRIVCYNMTAMQKNLVSVKPDDFCQDGSTTNVTSSFLIPLDIGHGFLPGHSIHISNLSPPKAYVGMKIKMKHYMIEWLLSCSSDVNIWKSMTVTKRDFFCETSDSENDNGNENQTTEDTDSQPIANLEVDDNIRKEKNTGNFRQSAALKELPRSIKMNMFRVFIEYFKIDSVLVTDSCQFTPSEIQCHPDFIAMANNWDERIFELTDLRKKYRVFKNSVFIDKLIEAVAELRHGTIDGNTKILKKRERTSKSRIESAKRKKL